MFTPEDYNPPTTSSHPSLRSEWAPKEKLIKKYVNSRGKDKIG